MIARSLAMVTANREVSPGNRPLAVIVPSHVRWIAHTLGARGDRAVTGVLRFAYGSFGR